MTISLTRDCYSMRIFVTLLVLTFFAGTLGCRAGHRGSQLSKMGKQAAHDPRQAQTLNEEGLALLTDGEVEQAEEKFRLAVELDLYNSSAHNNLGLALLRSKEHYEAAWELQTAMKLAPNAPEPRANLALLYEEIGRTDKAVTEYERVLEIDPSNTIAMHHLARAYVKINQRDDKLKDILEKILSIPEDGAWDQWARGQLIRLGRNEEE